MFLSKKNILTILISTFFSIFICYLLFCLKIHFERHDKNPNLFKSIDVIKFNKNYSKKLHHLRINNENLRNRGEPEDYLFSTVNEFYSGKNNILMQGDSWIEQMIVENKSYNLINDFVKKNNFGLVTAGIASYSPSLIL